MNKEQNLIMARQEIVRLFISKMDSVSMKDVGVIPALMDYVMTGDTETFEDYYDFHFIKSVEEKNYEIEYAKEKREDIRMAKDSIKKAQLSLDKCRESYNKAVDDYMKWKNDVLNSIVEADKTQKIRNAIDLKFVVKSIESLPYPTKQSIYVMVGKKIYEVNSVTVTDACQLLLGTGNNFCIPEPPVPIFDGLQLNEQSKK